MPEYADSILVRQYLRHRVSTCTACPLHSTSAHVPFSGPTPTRIAIMGEAPGMTEESTGEGFTGKSGLLLRRLLKEANVNAHDCLFCNVAACNPHGPPSPQTVDRCRFHRWDAIALAEPSIVILVGGVAYSLLETGLSITKAAGRPHFADQGDQVDGRVLWWGPVIFYPVLHPSYVLRRPQVEVRLADDLKAMEDRCSRDGRPMDCLTCGQDAEWFDRWGIGYCDKHKED